MPLGRSEDATGLIRNACLRLERWWSCIFSLFMVGDLQAGLRCNETLLFVGVGFLFFGVYPLLRFRGLSLFSAQSAMLLVL